jgi:hypothetical protein
MLKYYLKYLQEKEWDEKPGNDDAFDPDLYKHGIGNLPGPDPFNNSRHDLDTNLFDIYIKNSIGDYKGRTTSYNSSSAKNPLSRNIKDHIRKIKADYKKLNKNEVEVGQKVMNRAPDDDFDQRDTANVHNADTIPSGTQANSNNVGGGE